MKARQWEHTEDTIKVMEAIGRELAKFVRPDFVKNIGAKSTEIRSMASATAGTSALCFSFPSTHFTSNRKYEVPSKLESVRAYQR